MLDYIEKQLEEFSKLEDGWLGPNSCSVKKELFKPVQEISEFCESLGYNSQDVCPIDDGSFFIFLDVLDEYEIEISINSGSFLFLIFENNKFDYIDDYDLETDDIEKLKEHIQKVKSSISTESSI